MEHHVGEEAGEEAEGAVGGPAGVVVGSRLRPSDLNSACSCGNNRQEAGALTGRGWARRDPDKQMRSRC